MRKVRLARYIFIPSLLISLIPISSIYVSYKIGLIDLTNIIIQCVCAIITLLIGIVSFFVKTEPVVFKMIQEKDPNGEP